nr:hypothetical protein [Alphaproteobacteria bacterium]
MFQSIEPQSSDVSIIRREFVDLTGNHFSAVILNQLLYWTLRVRDFDLLLEEERQFEPDCNVSPRHGWIYKTAPELNIETMLGLSPPSVRKYLKVLIDQGWIDERGHPNKKWDRTTQYRVNLRQLQEDLRACGRTLPEVYLKVVPSFVRTSPHLSDPTSFEKPKETLNQRNFASNQRIFGSNENLEEAFIETPLQPKETHNQRIFASKIRNFGSNEKIFASNERNFASSQRNFGAIPENTTEIKNKEHTQRKGARENFSDFENLENSDFEKSISEASLDKSMEESVDESYLDQSVPDESGPERSVSGKPISDAPASRMSAPGESIVDESVTDESVPDESVAWEMISLWEIHVVQKLFPENWKGVIKLTEDRKGQLESLFAFHFKSDIRLWERFCLRVRTSSFMMGGGPRKWKVGLDWILDEGNFYKILEGNYDNSDGLEQYGSHGCSGLGNVQPNPIRDAEKAEIIESIQDPTWRDWCAQLSEGVGFNESQMLEQPLSTAELKQIAGARFLECEDERLVWVGSSDPSVLLGIEDLRHKINWVFAKQYPNARTFRTRLE